MDRVCHHDNINVLRCAGVSRASQVDCRAWRVVAGDLISSDGTTSGSFKMRPLWLSLAFAAAQMSAAGRPHCGWRYHFASGRLVASLCRKQSLAGMVYQLTLGFQSFFERIFSKRGRSHADPFFSIALPCSGDRTPGQ
jgi:hypothetical protein